MKIKFWLLAAFTAVAMTISATSCGNDEPEDTGKNDNNNDDIEVPTTEEENLYLNDWVDSYMAENYLWNTEYKALTRDKKLDYKDFLSTALNGMGNANKEDGYWVNGKRQFFYSRIERTKLHTSNAPSGTRLLENQAFGYGFTGLQIYTIGTKYYIVVLGVVPGSPAAPEDAQKPRLARASYITRVDGTLLSKSNVQEFYQQLISPTAPVKLNYVTMSEDANGKPVTSEVKDITLTPDVYTDTPIILFGAFSPQKGSPIRVGYIAYDVFNAAFDNDLISAFKIMQSTSRKELGGDLTDLILDLRYNNGGHLKSSLLLATLITGESQKGGLYCRTIMNADRMAKMEPQEYRIGQKKIAENDGGTHELIETALASAINMKRIFVFTGTYTASASELIINGLRGLGLEVNLIGDTTNGKNVGMEAQSQEYHGYLYDFAPITFRLENALGFGDYSSGFKPDVEITSADGFLIGDYMSGLDPNFAYTYAWLTENKKPEVSAPSATRSSEIRAIGEPHFAKRAVEGNLMRK